MARAEIATLVSRCSRAAMRVRVRRHHTCRAPRGHAALLPRVGLQEDPDTIGGHDLATMREGGRACRAPPLVWNLELGHLSGSRTAITAGQALQHVSLRRARRRCGAAGSRDSC